MSNRDNIFVFDIETIPDLEAARSLLKLETANDTEIYKAIAAYHDAEKPAEQVFLKPIFHKIVAISFANIAIDHNHEGEEYTIMKRSTKRSIFLQVFLFNIKAVYTRPPQRM